MKRLLLPLLAALTLPTAVNANWFSRDIVDINPFGEKTIVKKETVEIFWPVTVENRFQMLNMSIQLKKKVIKDNQKLIKDTKEYHAKCLANEEPNPPKCMFPQPFIKRYRKKIEEYKTKANKDIDLYNRIIPHIDKFKRKDILWVDITYTPIFVNINKEKTILEMNSVNCYNPSLDLSLLEVENKNKYLSSLEKRICKKYAMFNIKAYDKKFQD